MPMSEEEKRRRRYERMLQKARELMPRTYLSKFTAPAFQRMIRAEAGAMEGDVVAVVGGEIKSVFSEVGKCVCVSCGKVLGWQGDAKAGVEAIDTGHYIPSRVNSIVLDEDNVAPQCHYCNKVRHGNMEPYSRWMRHVRGQKTIDRLEVRARQSVTFTKEELVKLRIIYMERIDAAVATIKERLAS